MVDLRLSVCYKKEGDYMRFYFLGTSHGVPSAERYTSCYLLETSGNLYVFDAGAPVVNLVMQRGLDITKVKAFFCSHFHGDHIDGGMTLLSLFNWYYKTAELDAFMPDEISGKAVRNYLEAIGAPVFLDGRVRMYTTKPGVIFDDGVIRVTAIPVDHVIAPGRCAYGFSIEAEGKRILYTGDLSPNPHTNDFPAIAYGQHYDLIVTECAHFSVEKLEACLDRVDADCVAVSHIYPVTKIPQLRQLQSRYTMKVLVPDDGDELSI